MSFTATRWAWAATGLRPSQKLLLLALADRADDSGVCWPSQARLQQDTGLDLKTIREGIARLCGLGLVARNAGPGRGYIYALALAKAQTPNLAFAPASGRAAGRDGRLVAPDGAEPERPAPASDAHPGVASASSPVAVPNGLPAEMSAPPLPETTGRPLPKRRVTPAQNHPLTRKETIMNQSINLQDPDGRFRENPQPQTIPAVPLPPESQLPESLCPETPQPQNPPPGLPAAAGEDEPHLPGALPAARAPNAPNSPNSPGAASSPLPPNPPGQPTPPSPPGQASQPGRSNQPGQASQAARAPAQPDQAPPARRAPQAAKSACRAPGKAAYGRFGNVRLTEDEHAALLEEYGEKGLKAIAKLDIWLGARGDRYKSHYMAMHAWVLRAVDEDERRESQAGAYPGVPALPAAPSAAPQNSGAFPQPSTYAQLERANQKSVARLALMGRGVYPYGEQADDHHGTVHDADFVQPES